MALDHPELGDSSLSIVVYAYLDPADPFGTPIELDPMLGFGPDEDPRSCAELAVDKVSGFLKAKSSRMLVDPGTPSPSLVITSLP